MCSDALKTSPDIDGKFQTVILSESSSPEATSEINITHEDNVFNSGNYWNIFLQAYLNYLVPTEPHLRIFHNVLLYSKRST